MAGHRYPVDSFGEIGIPSAGMDTDTVPRLLPASKAPLLKNFLMDRPGILPMRGPICEGLTWDAAANIGALGYLAFDDKIYIGRAATSATGKQDIWTQLFRPATAANKVRGGDRYAYVDLNGTLISSGGDPLANVGQGVPISRGGIRIGDFVYGLNVGTAASPLHATDGFWYANNAILRWDGQGVAGANFVTYDLGPHVGVQDIAFHYNRLFAFGGQAPGWVTTINPSKANLYWSDPLANDGTGLGTAVTAWQDNVSGLTNIIQVGIDDRNDPAAALAHVGANLLLLKRRSLWVLYGTSPANFSVKQVSNEVGCIDPRSVVEYEGGVYFMSERGYMFYDGVRVRLVSQGLNSTLGTNTLTQVGPKGVDGGYCRATQLDHGYILVATGVMDSSTLAITADTDAWLLHAPSGAWTQLSSSALTPIIGGGRTANNTWLMSGRKIVRANYLFNPASAPTNRGIDSIDGGGTNFVIPSKWTTRALSLATPVRMTKLQRITLDYYWSLATGGWQTTAVTRSFTFGSSSSTVVLGAPTRISVVSPTRGAIDSFRETDELYLDISASDGGLPSGFDFAELHRVLVESVGTTPVPASM